MGGCRNVRTELVSETGGRKSVMDSKDIVKLVPGESESDLAANLKIRFEEAAKPLLSIMDEASSVGLAIEFGGIQRSVPSFRYAIIGLRVTKSF